ncbi:MAG: hypothetical protein GX458_09305 [Phyllobacteriaceae bacterium]|nr:hypothetical protein [Phyllobacteriaceae bacterium]
MSESWICRDGETTEAAIDPVAVAARAARTEPFLKAVHGARMVDGLTAEDLVLYLALGRLGVDASGRVLRLVPRTYLEITAFTGIPRETVRRKIGRLCDRGFARVGPRGVVLSDVETWVEMVETLFPTRLDGVSE